MYFINNGCMPYTQGDNRCEIYSIKDNFDIYFYSL